MLDITGRPSPVELTVREVRLMSRESRQTALEQAGLVHPRPQAITAELFCSGSAFFLAADKVQVKYETLRAVAVDGETVMAAAGSHGYSRAEYYPAVAAFSERGMAGLVDERRGRKGPTKLSAEIAAFLRDAPPSAPAPSSPARSKPASASACTDAPPSGQGDDEVALAANRSRPG
jgi:hypothetical protein